MTDRELLEKAAKAAGMTVVEARSGGLPWTVDDGKATRFTWNPLEDDGDALRLAVKLQIDLDWDKDGAGVIVECYRNCKIDPDGWSSRLWAEQAGSAPYAATRRAIVRTAASMGDE